MEKKELGKKVLIGVIVLGAFSGAAWGASRYWTGSGFQPTGSGRALRSNQVLFDDQRGGLSDEGGDSQDSFWEDSSAQDQVSGQQQPGYLFSPDETTPDVPTAGVVTPNGSGSSTGGTPSTGIEITDRPGSGMGTVISGGGTTGNNGGNNPTTPSDGVSGSGTVSDPYQGGDVIQDPNNTKDPPYNFGEGSEHLTDKNTVSPAKVKQVVIGKPWSTTAALLYRGETVDARAIFIALETYVRDTNNKVYYWDTVDLGKTFRIDSISFDGENWIDMSGGTTVTIPTEAETMYIRVSYRLRTKDDWTQAEATPYELEESRIFLLNTTVSSETALTEKMLVNFDKDNQHYNLGKKANLMRWLQELQVYRGQATYRDSPPLTTLFTGWTEDGKTVPWRYEVTAGRHVLQAPENVPYDTERYQVEIRFYWMGEDYAILKDSTADSLSYLQTLTYYKGPTATAADGSRYVQTLAVPKYVQAVDFPYYYISAETLQLPDTVLYVNTGGVPDYLDDEYNYDHGLQVTKAYTVSEGNPRYTAKDGILYNLDGTEILGVPTEVKKLTVDEGVTSVSLPYRCQVDTIILKTKDASQIPEIDYSRLKRGCKVLVEDDILEDFLRTQADILRSTRMTVATISAPDRTYTIVDGLIISKSGALHGVLDEAVRWLPLPDTVTGMEKNCLAGLTDVTMVHLPNSGSAVTLEEGCFDGAPALETIVCYSKEQYDEAKKVAPDGVEVILANTVSQDGYRYLDLGDGNIMLLEVPSDITEFTGRVPDGKGGTVTVTAISNDVFSNCGQLRWVDLAEEVTAIGQNAFRNCYSLEGVVIGATDTVMIGKGAFDGCGSLRFLASNAMNCDLRSPDLSLPCATNNRYRFLYCLNGADGYNSNWVSFEEADRVTAFTLQDCGGTRVLYAETDGNPWLALRSGGSIDGDVSLPAETEDIYLSAFADAVASDRGGFDLNWSQLDNLEKIFSYGFYHSGLGRNVVLTPDLTLDEYCFAECSQLVNITVPSADAYVNLGGFLFNSCHGLESVTIGDVAPFSTVVFGLFDDCGSLKELCFTGAPPRQSVRNLGMGFLLNYVQWPDMESEEANVRLVVPEDQKEAFVEAWRYGYTGYIGDSNRSNYQALWEEVTSLRRNQGEDTSDAAVKADVEARLTAGENHVRAMLGMEQVSAASHRYSYSVSDDGILTLTGAKEMTYAELTAEDLDMPRGWTLDYIGANAFAESPDLRMAMLPGTLAGISSGAFSGVTASEEDRLLLAVKGSAPPALVGYEEGTPFSFGIDDEAVEVMIWDDGCTAEDVLKAWLLPMTGYDSLKALHDGVVQALTAAMGGREPTLAQVQQIMLRSLLAAENRLRVILDMESITSANDMVGITVEEVAAICQLKGQAADPEEGLPIETVPEETGETEPETTEPEQTEPTETEPTEPIETEPTEPEETEPAATGPMETELEQVEETVPSEPEETAPAENSEPEA